MRLGVAAISALLATGCASYGLHHPARTLSPGQQTIGLSFDLLRFAPHKPEEARGADDLATFLFLPELQYRRGFLSGTEVDVNLLPVGIRLAGRGQFVGDATSKGAASVEVGLSLLAMADLRDVEDGNFEFILTPDVAVTGGLSPYAGGEGYLALRYAWFRSKVAGRNLSLAPAVTAGFAHERAPLAVGAEASLYVDPGSGDLIFGPGLSAGFLSR